MFVKYCRCVNFREIAWRNNLSIFLIMLSYGKNLTKAAYAAATCSHRRKPMARLICKHSREYGDSSWHKRENLRGAFLMSTFTKLTYHIVFEINASITAQKHLKKIIWPFSNYTTLSLTIDIYLKMNTVVDFAAHKTTCLIFSRWTFKLGGTAVAVFTAMFIN